MKILYIVLGSFFVILAFLGAFLPLIPTVPFLLLAAFFYQKGSDRLHQKLLQSKIYKYYLSKYWANGLTMKEKIKVLIKSSILLGIGFYFSYGIPIVSIIIITVWIGHFYYFLFRMETKEEDIDELP